MLLNEKIIFVKLQGNYVYTQQNMLCIDKNMVRYFIINNQYQKPALKK